LVAGGTLSHHHGVGKIRQDFLKDIYSDGARTVMQQVKRALDPSNLFGASNHGVRGMIALEHPSKDSAT
jgi:alkyldihydroxyacetonephosphate synthase